MREMSEDEFAEALPTLDTVDTIAITRAGERVGTYTPAVPEPRANGAAINEIIERYGVPLAEGESDHLLESLEELRRIQTEADGDPWRD